MSGGTLSPTRRSHRSTSAGAKSSHHNTRKIVQAGEWSKRARSRWRPREHSTYLDRSLRKACRARLVVDHKGGDWLHGGSLRPDSLQRRLASPLWCRLATGRRLVAPCSSPPGLVGCLPLVEAAIGLAFDAAVNAANSVGSMAPRLVSPCSRPRLDGRPKSATRVVAPTRHGKNMLSGESAVAATPGLQRSARALFKHSRALSAQDASAAHCRTRMFKQLVT